MITILVGAEGCCEIEGEPWVRPATEVEKKTWMMLNSNPGLVEAPLGPGSTLGNLMVDGIGRPYWFMTVDETTAPAEAVKKAQNFKRVKRLIE